MQPESNAICARCGRAFHIKPSKLASGRGRYCSRVCQYPDLDAPPAERVMALVNQSGNGCHEWTGSRFRAGYGQSPVRLFGTKYAHRIIYILTHYPNQDLLVDPIPYLRVCHHCDNPPCCRENHLFADTQAGNLADMRAKGRAAPPSAARRPGASNHLAKLTDPQATEVRRRYAAAVGVKRARRGSNGAITTLAREFGVTHSVIWRIVQGVSYPPVPD